MNIQEFWSPAEEKHLELFERAVAIDDPLRALLAIEGAPDELPRVRGELDALARQVKDRIDEATPERQAEALVGVLGETLQLRAGLEKSPTGAHLTEVLSSHVGHPGVLVILWQEVASRAGIRLEAVQSPLRLGLRLGGESGLLLDPAHGGERLVPIGSEARLPAVGLADLLTRVLKDAVACYALRNELLGIYRMVTFLAALRPQAPLFSLQRAAIAEQLGAQQVASEIYREVATRFVGTQESQVAVHKLLEAEHRAPTVLQ